MTSLSLSLSRPRSPKKAVCDWSECGEVVHADGRRREMERATFYAQAAAAATDQIFFYLSDCYAAASTAASDL